MRKSDCLHNLDTPVACVRRHQKDDNEVRILACRALEQHTAGKRSGITRGLHMKLRKQIICNLRFKRIIKLARF